MRLNYAIVYVSDMAKSVAFYRDSLGLPLGFETPEWTEFRTEGASLALHKADPAPAVAETPVHAGQCHPGIAVPDLDAFHEHAVANGVHCLQLPTPRFGARIARYADPDGLAISVSEQRRDD